MRLFNRKTYGYDQVDLFKVKWTMQMVETSSGSNLKIFAGDLISPFLVCEQTLATGKDVIVIEKEDVNRLTEFLFAAIKCYTEKGGLSNFR